MKRYLVPLLGVMVFALSACSADVETQNSKPTPSAEIDSREPAVYEYTSEIYEIGYPGEAVLYTGEGIYFSRFEENAENIPVQTISFLNFKDKSKVLDIKNFSIQPETDENGSFTYGYYHDLVETKQGKIAALKHTATTIPANPEAEPLSAEWLIDAQSYESDYIVVAEKNGKVLSENKISEKTDELPAELTENTESESVIPTVYGNFFSLAILTDGTFASISGESIVNFTEDGVIINTINTMGYPRQLLSLSDNQTVLTLKQNDETQLWVLSDNDFSVKKTYRIPDDCCRIFPGAKGKSILYCTTSPQALLGFSDGDGFSSVAIRFSEIDFDSKTLSVKTSDAGFVGNDIYFTAFGESSGTMFIVKIYPEKQ